MFERQLKTRLDLMKIITTRTQVDDKSEGKFRVFNIGDRVQIRNYTNKAEKWKFGYISQRMGTLLYEVDVDGNKTTRHVDQTLKFTLSSKYPGSNGSNTTKFVWKYA